MPTYPLLDSERKAGLIAWLREPGRRYLFLLPEPLEGLEPQMISHKQRNTWVYLYANLSVRTGLFRRRYHDSGRRFLLATPGFPWQPSTRVTVIDTGSNDVQYYKQVFLARNIDFTAAERGFVVFVGDRVLGFIEFTHNKYPGGFDFKAHTFRAEECWYMLSDFPVAPLPHPRASKLVLMLALCDDMRRLLDYRLLRSTKVIITTARTKRPVSMKYRGPMSLIKRNMEEGFLNYAAVWTPHTFQETYGLWWTKFGTSSTSSIS